MESYWKSAPTAEDFEQLVDPDAKAPCESASNFDPITIVIERSFYCIFCRWGGVNIGCDRFSSKLQIVSIFRLVAVGSGGVKILRRRLAGVIEGADEAGRGSSGRPDGDVGGGAAFAATRVLRPVVNRHDASTRQCFRKAMVWNADRRAEPDLSNTQVAYRR